MDGNPLTLVGTPVGEGSQAPDAPLTGVDMAPVSLMDTGTDKTKIIIAVPSVDTKVCSLESKTFSDRVKDLGPDVAAYVVSADLPFALKRWGETENVDNITLLSDYKTGDWGRAWGIHVKEAALLARAVYVVDKNGTVTYSEIVPEISSEPNYDAALAAAQDAK